jgi:DNA-binding PadR family transcriptional regulator
MIWHWLAASTLAMTVLAYAGWLSRRAPKTILRLLADGEWRTGRELIAMSRGKLKPASVYIWLYDLDAKGIIESEVADDEGRYRYRITPTEARASVDPRSQ